MILLLGSCSGAKAPSSEDAWLDYEPAIIELKGKLTIALKYGPPNYGENPETDEKVRAPILVLSQPVNVRADRESEFNTESFEGVKEVHLVFFTDRKIAYSHLVGRQVEVRGTLFQAHTGHHYTDVLMIVSTIREQPDVHAHL